MQTLSDEQLIAVSNDPDALPSKQKLALDELFSRYQSRVAVWCYRVVQDREWAADLAQEVFIRALRGLSSFRTDSKFSTWLYTIARNHCFNAIQSKVTRAEEPMEFLEIPDPVRRADSEIDIKQQVRNMQDLLQSTLDETERNVMTLHYGEELTLDSVTKLLGLRNASGAKAYVVSARRKLQSAVSRWKAGTYSPEKKV